MWNNSSRLSPWLKTTPTTIAPSKTPDAPPPTAGPDFARWLRAASPELNWDWRHLVYLQRQLQAAYDRGISRLIVSMPPQHGKTENTSVRFPVWWMVNRPASRVVVATHSRTLVGRISRNARKVARSCFPLSKERRAVSEWENLNGGSFTAVSVGSLIAGLPIDLLVMDDTIGSRAQADSAKHREKVWDWYTNDIIPRLQPGAPIVLVQTRWHEDDLIGRILSSEDGPNWVVINLPAEAEENDPLGRPVGEALCPERFTLAELQAKHRIMGNDYVSLYQGRPYPRGGLVILRAWLERHLVDLVPRVADRVRYWDKAATPGSGAYSTGVLMARTRDGLYWVEDVVRGQWSAGDRNAVMLATAQYDREQYGRVKQMFETEGGSGGKESAEISVRELAGFDVEGERVTGAKEVRIGPFASQAQGGNVRIAKRGWTRAYVDELAAFPRATYKDQVDATSGAFNRLARGTVDHGIYVPAGGGSHLGNLLNERT